MVDARPWSDELAGKTIDIQVKTIDRLTAENARLRQALAALHGAIKAQKPPLPMGPALAHAWSVAGLVLDPRVA